ncbi:uncharacterized protein [Dermacentor albipictus]|uniref:uncharacterized protein n=1 Tax=Dermacentor albipictus TaxID=60249 RepID=UPI0031FE3803
MRGLLRFSQGNWGRRWVQRVNTHTFWVPEYALHFQRRTSSDPGASPERDRNSGCKCQAGCRCSSAAVGCSEQPAAKIEPEGPKEIESACNIYPYSICDDCRARLGKEFDGRAESCAMALLELRYGAAACETSLSSGDGTHHGEREAPMENLSGPSVPPNESSVSHTSPKPLRLAQVSPAAGDADQAMVSLLKGVAKRRRKCSCGAAGTSANCKNCCTPNAATSGPTGRSATVSRPSTSAAARSTTTLMIQLPARSDDPNSNAPSLATPVFILPAVVIPAEPHKSSENEDCPSRE